MILLFDINCGEQQAHRTQLFVFFSLQTQAFIIFEGNKEDEPYVSL
jgi:hypothetical protein